jgi:hypothetical protein
MASIITPQSADTIQWHSVVNRFCGLVVRVPGYRSKRPEFDSRRYQIFQEIVGLEQGPLSLVSTTEELAGSNSSRSGLEIREYGSGDREFVFCFVVLDQSHISFLET